MCKIKICGLFRRADAAAVNAAMPDYAGFVCWPHSRRYVTPKAAADLKRLLDPAIQTAGVFVDAALDEILSLADSGTVDIVQLHGHESEEVIRTLRQARPGLPIWKAFVIRTLEDIRRAEQTEADMPLLDNGYGTGRAFDHSLIAAFSRPYILAGGLTAENLPQVLTQYHPAAVDLSSGVETEGLKDPAKILQAVQTVHHIKKEI